MFLWSRENRLLETIPDCKHRIICYSRAMSKAKNKLNLTIAPTTASPDPVNPWVNGCFRWFLSISELKRTLSCVISHRHIVGYSLLLSYFISRSPTEMMMQGSARKRWKKYERKSTSLNWTPCNVKGSRRFWPRRGKLESWTQRISINWLNWVLGMAALWLRFCTSQVGL